MLDLPWIITFGPLGDADEWEPVVCGPYERAPALALAEVMVAEEALMAVVEPLLPAVSAEQIRDEITAAQTAAEQEAAAQADSAELYGSFEDTFDEELATEREPPAQPAMPPSEAAIRAGFARIAANLPGPER